MFNSLLGSYPLPLKESMPTRRSRVALRERYAEISAPLISRFDFLAELVLKVRITLHILSPDVLTSSQEYWQGLAAGTYFSNRRLNTCIGLIHQEILKIWNFRDDDRVLYFYRQLRNGSKVRCTVGIRTSIF
jgi:hypothetical protein